MTRRFVLLVGGLALLLAAVVVGIVLARDGADTAVSPAPRDTTGARTAPALEGEDPITGERVSLAEFRGTPVVINVWASWCVGCIEEAADLREFAEAHPEAVVLGIDFQDTRAGAKDFYRTWGWTHPSIWDGSGTMASALGLVGMPTTYFLDERHRIVTQVVGTTDRAGFERRLELATS
jgi:thiol-disulfide isomerase/thioredoxin